MATWLSPLAPDGDHLRWSVGTCTLRLRRTPTEWRLHVERSDDTAEALEVHRDLVAENDEEQRISADSEPSVVRIRPLAPPRPIVARPERPLTLLPRRQVVVFVGMPVWIRVELDDGTELAEVPSVIMRDTWFGTPLDGTLCFATTTHLTRDRDALPPKAHRALCQVDIHNASDEPLVLERLRIPAPALQVYADADGRLWTSRLMVRRTGPDSRAQVDVVPLTGHSLMSEARSPAESGLVQAFNALWPLQKGVRP